MATEHKFREQEVQITRYRLLEREVTDPLAAGLLHIIILELEADLQKDCEIGQSKCQGNYIADACLDTDEGQQKPILAWSGEKAF